MTNVLKVHDSDNVLVALEDLPAGATVRENGTLIPLPEKVSAKHKLVTRAMSVGDPVVMYGVLVGRATQPIPLGGAIHTGNVKHATAEFDHASSAFSWTPPDVSRWKDRTFMGYHRSDGQVGTSNYWLVIPLVFCENRNIAILRDAFEKELGYAQPALYQHQVAELVRHYRAGATPDTLRALAYPSQKAASTRTPVFEHVDGIQFLSHEGGCGGTRQDARTLCALLAGYIHNPNVAGATVLSLGCQNAQIEILQEELHRRNPAFDKPLYIYEQQRGPSEYDMLSDAIRQTFAGLVEADRLRRAPAPLSALTFGVECGGSDGFSGISANPAMGHAADLLVALGGTVILSEFPELCGVEQELINRSVTPDVGDRFIRLMREYSRQAEAVGSGLHMNPSPGNIKDGLITDAIKSAGAAKKGGTSPITGVLGYPEYATARGLNLLCTPGNDVESTTGMAGAGANIMAFSTGLGTPTGNPIAPVIKVSTNTKLAQRLPDIIDLDCGPIVAGERSIPELGEELLEMLIRVASGEMKTKAQILGQHDFIPWKQGVSL
ncbi:MAG: altronate dehydratase family protein [Rhodothermales bacterium]|nr:altronate dehydratase family protein [Rhodothermales bacterium]